MTNLLIANNEALQNAVENSSTLAVKKSICEVERVLDKYEQVTDNQNIIWLTVASAFDHKQAIKPLDISVFLYTMAVSTIITEISPKAVAECLGMLVHIDYQNRQNSRFYKERHPREVKLLLEYFNEDGSFKENPRENDFEKILYNLVAKDFKDKSPLFVPEAVDSLPKDLRILLEESNEQYRKLHAQERRVAKELAARERLSRYYADGRVVEIPFDKDDFLDSLNNSGFTESEREKILRHVDNRIQMRGYRVAVILEEEELQTYLDSKNLIDTLSSNKDEYRELDETLKNLSSIADLLSYDLDKNEREYLEVEKYDALEKLKRILEEFGFGGHLETDAKAFTVKPVAKKKDGGSK